MCIKTVFYFYVPFIISIIVKNVQSLERENINGGLDVKLGDYPYHVHVEIQHSTTNTIADCNGAILDDIHVVTAAHCITNDKGILYDPMTIKVEAGTIYLKDEPLYRGFVKGIYLPAEFYRDHRIAHADIAVLKLDTSIDFESSNGTIDRIKLAERNKTYEGSEADFTGFGYNDVKHIEKPDGTFRIEGSSNERLHHGETLILSEDDCLHSISSKTVLNFDDQFCARMKQHSGDVYRGACRGDSGGPLVVSDFGAKKKILVGVLSFSTPYCIEKIRSSRYTRVSRYVDFIEKAWADQIYDPAVKYTEIQVNDYTYDNCVL